MCEFSELQISIIDDVFCLFNEKDRNIRKSYLYSYIKEKYEPRFATSRECWLYCHSVIDTILIKQYNMLEMDGANISLSILGRQISKSKSGIRGYIAQKQEDEKLDKIRKRLSITDIIVKIVGYIAAFSSFIAGNAIDSITTRTYLFMVGSFTIGVVLSTPIKNLLRRKLL